jgi:hypothetical protein
LKEDRKSNRDSYKNSHLSSCEHFKVMASWNIFSRKDAHCCDLKHISHLSNAGR